MKFRTEVNIPESQHKIGIHDSIFSIGSCFATEISERLSVGQLQTLNNPFGTIFNPFSIHNSLYKITENQHYTTEDLIFFDDEFLSLDHHTFFNSSTEEETLSKINQSIENAQHFLSKTNWVIITYGTSFIYEYLPLQKWVANCHKIPQKNFEKRLLSTEEILNTINKSIHLLQHFCGENVQILLTVSPVRHTKDGFVENNLSKAKLISAVHEVVSQNKNVQYLPVYELVMDDLRDYRFYKEDLIHPNNQAVQYIWEKFGKSYFSVETQDFISENEKIVQALQHRPKHKNSPKHQAFLQELNRQIEVQKSKVKHDIFKTIYP